MTREEVSENFQKAQAAFERMAGCNETECKTLKNEIAAYLYNNMSFYRIDFYSTSNETAVKHEFDDIYLELVWYVWNKYDLSKGDLENFFNRSWKYRKRHPGGTIEQNKPFKFKSRKKQMCRLKNKKTCQLQNKKTVSVKKKRKKPKQVKIVSLEAISEENNGNLKLGSSEPPDIETEMDRKEKIAELLVELLTDINQINRRKGCKHDKQDYFRLFYTGYVTHYCKDTGLYHNTSIKNREKTIMDGLDKDFLDFYMAEICRCLKAIQDTELKYISEVREDIDSERNARLKTPLLNWVYEIFFHVTPGNISQQREKFKAFVEKKLKQYL